MLLAIAAGAAVLVFLALREEPEPVGRARGKATSAANAEPSAAVQVAILNGCRAMGVEPAFGFAVAACESRFNPNAQLNTLGRTDLREGTIPERSLGLFQVNVNPNKPVGRARIAKLAAAGLQPEALFDPSTCTGFWIENVVWSLMERERRRGLQPTNPEFWLNCRVGLYASTLSVTGARAQEYKAIFRPVFEKWAGRFPLGGQ